MLVSFSFIKLLAVECNLCIDEILARKMYFRNINQLWERGICVIIVNG